MESPWLTDGAPVRLTAYWRGIPRRLLATSDQAGSITGGCGDKTRRRMMSTEWSTELHSADSDVEA
jgi:hypothetical protein